MAIATKQTETVETVKSVTLELTLDEARTLAVVLARVGGDPDHSPRKHGQSVSDALESVHISSSGAPEHGLISRGVGTGVGASLYFDDYPEAV